MATRKVKEESVTFEYEGVEYEAPPFVKVMRSIPTYITAKAHLGDPSAALKMHVRFVEAIPEDNPLRVILEEATDNEIEVISKAWGEGLGKES